MFSSYHELKHSRRASDRKIAKKAVFFTAHFPKSGGGHPQPRRSKLTPSQMCIGFGATMNTRFSKESASPALRPLLPFLLLLFFGSGCAALIYEIVWFQMLQLVIGSSAVSLGVLVGTYMGGMCLGSVVLPRIIPATRHPLRVYALLESGIGLLGILILVGMPEAARIYSAHVRSGLTGILLRGLFASACLLPPTILMGATLPAMARRLESTPHGGSQVGSFS